MTFLANPWKIWDSGSLSLKRTVLRLAFVERISYARNSGLRTPNMALPFKVLGGSEEGKNGSGAPNISISYSVSSVTETGLRCGFGADIHDRGRSIAAIADAWCIGERCP